MTQKGKELMEELRRGMAEIMPEKGERQIVVNALDVFARKGLAGTKISDIARQAGFSQGFVYNYFKSKDELFTKIVDLAAEGAGRTARKACEMPGTPYARLYWMAEALLAPESAAMHHWRLVMLQAATLESVPEEAQRVAREKAALPFRYVVPLIEEGQRLGEFVGGDPPTLALAYFSFLQGLGIARTQVGQALAFPPVEWILSFLRAPGCAAVPQDT